MGKKGKETLTPMKHITSPLLLALTVCIVASSPQLIAQNSTQLFTPINVRQSTDGTSYSAPATFNSNTLSLSCGATPSAILSSASGGSGFILVDNNIYVSNLTSGSSPVNVCTGGVDSGLSTASCFTTTYQNPAGNGQLNTVDPDSLLPAGGVAPIDISSFLVPNEQQQLKIDLLDEGGYLTSSTLYLTTNCSSAGVSGPALISGNTIPPSNPTPQQLTQDFTFNTSSVNIVNFEYDLSGAQAANTLTIDSNGVNPQVGDSYIDPSTFQPVWAAGTPFATSSCLIHSGESLPSGQPACKLYTLECTTGTGSTASGAQCPVSSQSNEVFRDIFDGPPFTLPDIPTPGGPTFHEGIGFLMASEGWTGGGCTFDPASGLEDLPCPQNLLTSFAGPGGYSSTATTSHPNSTFITVAQVPEDLTTVTVAGLRPGNWINTSSAAVTFSSLPPYLAGTSLPGAASFVASPIASLTYGISPASSVPSPGAPIASDVTVDNQACPAPAAPGAPALPAFTPPVQTLTGLEDGSYLLHYYAQDCAGTRELLFTEDPSGSWSTNFYTFPINVDTVPPALASGPTLSAAPPYYQGQPVTISYQCTDAGSGVVACGSQSFPGGTADTGILQATIDTSSAGSKMFTVLAIDAAGNQTSQSVNYSVAVDTQIALSFSPTTITYPLGTNLQVHVANINGHVPTGTVVIMENGTPIVNLKLNGGAVYYYLSGLSAGTHSLSAVYSGDKYNAAGTSAPVVLNVLPVPVNLSISCWNTPYPYGADFHCGAYASSNAGAPHGSITYVYDGGAPVTLALSSGTANFIIPKPPVGNHSVVVRYPAQTNYAAATPQSKSFSVTPAPVIVLFTPSSWYLTGGTLTLTASIQSWSAGPPNALGAVTFTDGNKVLAVVPVNAAGTASDAIAASALTNGKHNLTASYGGGANYATGSTSVTIQVAH